MRGTISPSLCGEGSTAHGGTRQVRHGHRSAQEWHDLPEDQRVELISGNLIWMDAPLRPHQRIVGELFAELHNYIRAHGGSCEADIAPFAVNLCADESTYVLPDVLVTCDRSKLSDRGCEGAPDFVAEVVSPSSRRMDYMVKMVRYEDAGVREYWIVDPQICQTTVYRFGLEGPFLTTYAFNEPVPVGIFEGLSLTIAGFLD